MDSPGSCPEPNQTGGKLDDAGLFVATSTADSTGNAECAGSLIAGV